MKDNNTETLFKEGMKIVCGWIVTGIIEALLGWILTLTTSLVPITVILVFAILNLTITGVLIFYYRKKIKEFNDKQSLYSDMGIVDCMKELTDNELSPSACMKTVKHHLSFMGVGGEKWVKEPSLMNEFRDMLKKVNSEAGEVKFLLLSPASESYKQLCKLRKDEVPVVSYTQFAILMNEFTCLKVKLYDHLPSFRMQFVDKTYVAISRYYFDQEFHSNADRGWKIPHVIIYAEHISHNPSEQIHKGSLYTSFSGFYDYLWKHSMDLQDWINAGRVYNK
jgi:hypothetical protein